MWTTKAQISLRIHAVWSAPLLFAAWIVTRFYSSKLYSSIGTYTVSPTYQFAESVLSLHVHLLKSKFYPAGKLLYQFCFSVSIILNKRFCEFWGTDFLIVSGQWNQSLYGYIQKGYFAMDICKNSVWRLPLFTYCWQEDCVLLETLRKLQRVVHVWCVLCALGFKKDGKVRKLERLIPVWVLMFRPLTFWTRTFRPLIIVLLYKIYVSAAISVI